MARVFNFSAGPAALPEEVLLSARDELLDYKGCGMSVLEMSHRSPQFKTIYDETEACLRRVIGIPENYKVLFLQGGATLQFAGIPMNLMRHGQADYLVTGNFAKKAWQEAKKYGTANVIASSEDTNFDRIPDLTDVKPTEGSDYVYICQNNTIFGTMFHELPETGDTPLVADVSSCFLSQPLDITKYGLVYAGAQKNAGPAGVTVVIVRDDLIGDGPAIDLTPTYMGYAKQASAGSMLNTPNCFGIYLCGKVFAWVEKTGGLEAMGKRNAEKTALAYDYLDGSEVFHGTAQPESRSIANVTFRCDTPELDAEFVKGAAARGLAGIKGHRLVGGMRASCYNAVPREGVEKLVEYMADFEKAHK